MPARSKVSQLPPEIRDELDRRLVAGAFSGYTELAEWLDGTGHRISRSALHDHGSKLERKIEAMRLATEQARAIVAGAPDSEGAMSEATLRMAQERLFTLLNEADGGSLKDVATAARAVAEMARAGISVAAERRKALAAAAERVDRKLAEAADSAEATDDPREVLRRIRQDVYGIFDG